MSIRITFFNLCSLKELKRDVVEQDTSHPAMFVDLSSCIQCDRGVRACREEQANDVIGVFGRGAETKIVFDSFN